LSIAAPCYRAITAKTLFFGTVASYTCDMTEQNKGPWGTPDSNDDGNGGDPPSRSPWQPSSAGEGGEARRGQSLEELIRRGKGPFGPQLPQCRPGPVGAVGGIDKFSHAGTA
jgi:hypothetical protein